jgi:hypothetical protein
LCLVSFGQFAYGEECSERDAYAAETLTGYLDSWQNVAQWFRQFRSCDDGGIAEGVSDAVARLLANQWLRLPELMKLSAENPDLEPFVLMHLDGTDNADDLRRIEHLARTKCPTGAAVLCKKLKTRVDSLGPQP